MKSATFITLIYFLFLPFAHANLQVGITNTEASDGNAVISLTMKNSFAQPVKAARAWLILLDGDGKIVGQKAQWLSGGEKSKKSRNKKKAKKDEVNLAVDEEQNFKMKVKTTRKAEVTKITFSRIVLEDGTMPDPVRTVVPLEDKPSE